MFDLFQSQITWNLSFFLNFQDFSRWLKKILKKESDRKNQKSTLEDWPNFTFKVKLELF